MWIELLVAARVLGLSDALAGELSEGPDMVTKALIDNIVHEPRRSKRMIGELEEVARTFEGLGLTPRMLDGAADMHRMISATPVPCTVRLHFMAGNGTPWSFVEITSVLAAKPLDSSASRMAPIP